MPFPKPADKRGIKAKRPHCGVQIDKAKTLYLIKEHRGNLSACADALGCARHSLDRKCKEDPELTQALLDARERWIDDIEKSVLTRADTSNDTGLQCFVLKTQAKHRGWDQDTTDRKAAQDIATAAFEFVLNKSKNPAE